METYFSGAEQISKTVKTINKKLTEVFRKYNFTNVIDENILHQNLNEINRIKESQVVIIDKYKIPDVVTDSDYLIIGFEKTIISIKQSKLPLLKSIFQSNPNCQICFLSDSKSIFDNLIELDYQETKIHSDFFDEISRFNDLVIFKSLTPTQIKIWMAINRCIFGYLIKKSYLKQIQNRVINFTYENSIKTRNFSNEDFIELKSIGIGSISIVSLAYHIENEELVSMKRPNIIDNEMEKLYLRETENYSEISYPFISKFYGTTKENNYQIIEFISGKTLYDINKIHLDMNEKISVIFELMLTIEYLHQKKFVYRDLKPSNVMIDKNKDIVLIDFDRMIKKDDDIIYNHHTIDFSSPFVAPEVNKEIISEQNDIYSLGKMIFYILNERIPEENESINQDKSDDLSAIDEIYKECINNDFNKRPSISYLIQKFVINYYSQIKIQADILYYIYNEYYYDFFDMKRVFWVKNILTETDDATRQFFIAIYYYDGKYIPIDIDKAIHYFLISANQNNTNSLIALGTIYSDGEYVPQDINKGIHYYELASNLNDSNAQTKLALIYYQKNYAREDIDKAIHYFTLAAENGNKISQFYLGEIYFERGEIDKAYNYYLKAAEQNVIYAQEKIGIFYYNGYYVKKDINKALLYFISAAENNSPISLYYLGEIYFKKGEKEKSYNYFMQAAEQNQPNAQECLGIFYYKGYYVKKDIEKAIYYFTLASEKNCSVSQFHLGDIYFSKGEIEKALHYYFLAAEKNQSNAQSVIGKFYIEGKFLKQDINKGIHYLTLSANQNNSEAQFKLGFLYLEGKHVLFNISKIIHYFTLAANQDHPIAQLHLGLIYFEGRYVKKDIYKSIHYITLAANHGQPIAEYLLGCFYYEGRIVHRDINKSIYYYSLAASKNLSNAQYILGIIYLENQCIDKGIHYLFLAANQNHPNAQFTLGSFYFDGTYLEKNIGKVIHYFTLAAKQNHEDALYYLAAIYYSGFYVPRNIDKSINYLKLAADLNHPHAQLSLGLMYFEGKNIKQDIDKGIYYLSMAAKQNISDAQLNLGVIFLEGKFVKKDIQKGIYYLTMAANQNNSTAQFVLGNIYFEGKIVPRDSNKDIYYLTLASNQNNSSAQLNLGIYYLFEKLDINQAVHYFSLSSKNGNTESSFIMGYIYHEGKFVKRDINKAISFYKEGSSFNNSLCKNNLAVIYKNGFSGDVPKNVAFAIELFMEAIKQQNDSVSMFNLATIYLFDENEIKNEDKSIELLFKSSINGFNQAKELLCLVLIKKFEFDIVKIKNELNKFADSSNSTIKSICTIIQNFQKLENYESIYENLYQYYQNINYIYNYLYDIIPQEDIINQKLIEFKQKENIKMIDINSNFYEGFGTEL